MASKNSVCDSFLQIFWPDFSEAENANVRGNHAPNVLLIINAIGLNIVQDVLDIVFHTTNTTATDSEIMENLKIFKIQ